MLPAAGVERFEVLDPVAGAGVEGGGGKGGKWREGGGGREGGEPG